MVDLGVGCCLLGLSLGDIRKRKIPLWAVLLFWLVCILYGIWENGIGQVLSGLLPGMLLGAAAIGIPDEIGMGDGIVTMAYGGIYGWQRVCLWLVISFFLAAVSGLFICIIYRRKKVSLPFVPFLAAVHVGICL